jgi:hypothetical protein
MFSVIKYILVSSEAIHLATQDMFFQWGSVIPFPGVFNIGR